MSGDHDDDALNWAGDDDPTLQPGEPEPRAWDEAVVGAPAQGGTAAAAPVDAQRPAQLSSALLIVLGILAGVYLLYTIGWAINAGRDAYQVESPVDQIMYTVGLWLAVAAAPLWFAATLWFTKSHTASRVVWLVVGAVVLIPWPFVIGGL